MCSVLFYLFIYLFLGQHLCHIKVPRLGVQSELQLMATAMQDLNWDLNHSSLQYRIPYPVSETRDQTHILMDPSQVYHWATMETPRMWSVLMNAPLNLKKSVFCCCWIEYSKNVYENKLIDNSIQFIYVLTDFLSAWIVNYWQMSIEVSKNDNRFFYFLFYQSLAHIVWCSVVGQIYIMGCYVILEMQ